MSSKILVFVEGDTEEGFLRGLAERLSLRLKVIKMRGNRPDKLRGWLKVHRPHRCIVLKDLHRRSEEFVEELKRQLARLKIELQLSEEPRVVLVRRAIEAWFLADEVALKEMFGCDVPAIENPEALSDPARKLSELLRARGKEYVKSYWVARKIAEILDIRKVSKKSKSFSEFLRSIKSLS